MSNRPFIPEISDSGNSKVSPQGIACRSIYVICSGPEMGGELLAAVLSQTGCVGDPLVSVGYVGNLADLIARATGPNGICGITLRSEQAGGISAVLSENFASIRYFWLRRRNRIAQAVAFHRRSYPHLSESAIPTETDFANIDQLFAAIVEDDRRWEEFFRQNNLRPIVLVYEELVTSFERTIRGLVEAVGESSAGLTVTTPDVNLVDDIGAEEWERLYIESRKNLRERVIAITDPVPAREISVSRQSRATGLATDLRYIICTEPRTGSTLLGDALTGTRIAGEPDEYFALGGDEDYWLTRFGADHPSEYVDRVVEQTTTANGAFGMKLHWHHTEFLRAKLAANLGHDISDPAGQPLEALLREKWPTLRYVWLRRKNKVAQGISYYRASRTGVWRSLKGRHDHDSVPDRELVFDSVAIDHFVQMVRRMDWEWNHYFRTNRIATLMIYYEDLIVNYELVVRGVLKFLGLPHEGVKIPEPGLEKQADERSNEWEIQYHTRNIK